MEESLSNFVSNDEISNVNTTSRVSPEPTRSSPIIFLSPPKDAPRSPQLQLTRADLYRQKAKPRKVMSNLEIEVKRKKKERRLMRTQSSPSFPPDLDVTDSTLGQKNRDLSRDKIDANIPKPCYMKNDENVDKPYKRKDFISSNCKISSPMIRKKSLGALMDLNLKKIIENGSNLKRSQSQRISQKPKNFPIVTNQKHFATDEDDDSDECANGEGKSELLFQATTLFVPGYDFKKKQRTSSVTNNTRKQSTPVLPRRSSKERLSLFFDKVTKEKIQSTPCLMKRDSREKMKKMDLVDLEEENFCKPVSSASPSPDHDPPTIIVDSQSYSKDDDFPNKLNEDFTKCVILTQRQAKVASEEKKFTERRTTPNIDILPNIPLNVDAKKIAEGCDDGSAYVQAKNRDNDASNSLLKKETMRSDLDTVSRDRTRSCEIGSFYKEALARKDEDRRSLQLLNGSESGYASLADSYKLGGSYSPMKNNCNRIDGLLNHSWSHSDWKERDSDDVSRNLNPVKERVVSTDLCVTEL